MRKAIEILKESPLSLAALRSWIRNDMAEQFKEQEEIAKKENPNFETMREMWLQEQLQVNELANVLENNSPYLFNFFDTHNLFIKVGPDVAININFTYMIFDEDMNHLENFNGLSTRREASFAAIDEAFKLLENKLA